MKLLDLEVKTMSLAIARQLLEPSDDEIEHCDNAGMFVESGSHYILLVIGTNQYRKLPVHPWTSYGTNTIAYRSLDVVSKTFQSHEAKEKWLSEYNRLASSARNDQIFLVDDSRKGGL